MEENNLLSHNHSHQSSPWLSKLTQNWNEKENQHSRWRDLFLFFFFFPIFLLSSIKNRKQQFEMKIKRERLIPDDFFRAREKTEEMILEEFWVSGKIEGKSKTYIYSDRWSWDGILCFQHYAYIYELKLFTVLPSRLELADLCSKGNFTTPRVQMILIKLFCFFPQRIFIKLRSNVNN